MTNLQQSLSILIERNNYPDLTKKLLHIITDSKSSSFDVIARNNLLTEQNVRRISDIKNCTLDVVLTRYDGEVSEPRVGRQGSRVSMRVARGSASLLPSHGRGIWPGDLLKKVSRGLSRVEAGNPGFPRLVQVTSGGFSWWL